MTKHVGILAGGWNGEREISLISATAAQKALESKGYATVFIDVTKDLSALIETLNTQNIDVVFNGLHGTMGEDGTIQGVLEYLNIPYTHSGVLASALAMDKHATKQMLANHGICSAKADHVKTHDFKNYTPTFPGPYVLKPNSSGSACGVHIEHVEALSPAQIADYAAKFSSDQATYGPDILVEQYIPGLELTVGVIANKPLTVTNIISNTSFYDYEAKYAPGGSSHQLPADIPAHIFDQALTHASAAHTIIGAYAVSRSDFRYDPKTDQLYFLEINTQPGLTPTSLLPEQAVHCGMSFEELVAFLVETATCHAGIHV